MDVFQKLSRLPVVAAIAKSAAIVAGVSGAYMGLKDMFDLPTPPRSLLFHVAYWTGLNLSFLVFHYRSSRSATGALGKTFEYDKDGVLWHGTEKAIAFRVTTFLHLLQEVGDKLSEQDARQVLLQAGRVAARDFAEQFGTQIYPAELRHGGPAFHHLSRPERLALWSEYDSSTGWGLLAAFEKPGAIDVLVKHPTLFRGLGGSLFAHYLAGYSETVVNSILGDFGATFRFAGKIVMHERTISFSLALPDAAKVNGDA
jgi:hypothetical protein